MLKTGGGGHLRLSRAAGTKSEETSASVVEILRLRARREGADTRSIPAPRRHLTALRVSMPRLGGKGAR